MPRLEIRVVVFDIPNHLDIPAKYKNGSVEIGAWPFPEQKNKPERDELGRNDSERLEHWTIENIFMGLVNGDYTEDDLIEDYILLRVLDENGTALIDTFIPQQDRFSLVFIR